SRRLETNYDTAWARRYPARVARLLVNELVTGPVIRTVADPRVTGLDRIAHLDGPVVFAANHASHLDTPLLLSVIPDRWRHRTVVAAAADYFFDTRLKSAFFALWLAAIPIERRRVNRDSANRASALLSEGWSLLIYPEGGRTPDGWGRPHSAGAAWLAERSGRPLVPVYVEGTRRILARGSWRLRPGSAAVTFGRPLVPQGDIRRLAADLERAVDALGDEQGSDWWTARRRAAAGSTPSLTGPAAGAWRRSWALGDRRRRSQPPPRWPR
ncbi:MAG TPA: lysophospholipid acyltransferase family protein, partial [Acidimicrobiales bacterium]|nr:lysophospholipid acyltransferase family protein [Acidimicrobiales bacterium]